MTASPTGIRTSPSSLMLHIATTQRDTEKPSAFRFPVGKHARFDRSGYG
jgi:hypothetical protein